MKTIWSARARRDFDSQFEYLLERQPKAAIAAPDRLLGAVARLPEFPMPGRQGRVSGTRELVLTGTPYIVVYDVSDQSIRILRIFHSAQDYPPRP